ncbi:Hachiman antiphage defense system protein HamA [Alteromonas macleodii]|uniref:Hachiman antiphage defense system protein HamA n=1 Tax=Alteromonas macleodii TaxID=28108 RepID=UPI00313BEDEE
MLSIKARSDETEFNVHNDTFTVLNLKESEFENIKNELINILPEHYVAPESIADILSRLGKKAASRKLLDKIPEVANIRSGDIGEALTTAYIEESTEYSVPIRKLRWRDHRNMAMRGDDVIGFVFDLQNQRIQFLKAEAKGNRALSNDVLQKARKELDNDDGLPAPHALAFVSDRLRELGNAEIADLIEKIQLVEGIRKNQVEHLLFTFTASDPNRLQRTAFDNYEGSIRQKSVGFRVLNHADLVDQVYQGLIDGLNN